MAIKLHRCSNMWVKFRGHPCWRVQKALNDMSIEYEVVQGPLRRGNRTETLEKTGQKLYPWIEFEDGRVLYEDSKELEARIREGQLHT